jgi:hypothetical protein
MNVGTVNGGMASCAPTGPLAKEGGVVDSSDVNLAGGNARAGLILGVAFEAKIRVGFEEEFPIA